MNIGNAIRTLQNGDACRPGAWRGYVERIDIPAPQYSALATYEKGDKVTYEGYGYMCTVETTSPGPFDSSVWARVYNDRYIVFIDASDSDATVNPSAIYKGEVVDTDDNVSWTRLDDTSPAPDEVKAVHTSWTGNCPSPVNMPDAQMFAALISDSWYTGAASDYEKQRVGSSDRW